MREAIIGHQQAVRGTQLQAHEWDDDEGQSACDPRPSVKCAP